MKPPETVTLIDLEGNIILEANTNGQLDKPQNFTQYCSITSYEDSGGYYVTELKEGASGFHSLFKWVDNLPYEERTLQYKLVGFINDQLTFIRNGMWETLAIYQATLGRYTEVPWYDPKVLEPKHEQNYNVRALDEYDLSKGYFDQEYTDLEGCQYCANAKEFTWAMFVHEHLVIGLDENVPQEITAMAIQPMLEDFIKYYPDVFSKLTPLEGK